MSNVIKKVATGLLALVVLGIAFFFIYVVKTPHYSLYQIHQAVQKHDTVLFEKHVNLDSIYGKGIDALIASGMKREKTIGMDPFVAGIMKMLKPTVVQAMKNATLESVQKEKKAPEQSGNGRTAQANQDKPAKKKNKLENQIPLVKKLKERLDISNLQFKDASVDKKNDNVAALSVLLHDVKLDRDFNAKMRMEKLSDGEWQIVEVTNLVELLTQMEVAASQAVKEAATEK